MTPLADLLARRIAATGPITVADYMAECLLHPEHGYYTRAEPFGAAGDFTTAPEISQMFGELIGLWLAQVWLDQGAPVPFTLAELGPGRGTLMADALRATQGVPGFHQAAQIHLVEAAPRLRAAQKDALEGYAVTWHDTVDGLPDAPLFVIANEFFDALPIRQFQRDAQGWRERQVGLVDGALTLGLSAPAPLAELDHRLADTRPGEIVETCPAAAPTVAALATRIAAHGGAALIVDYGDWHARGDTLQALYRHAYDPPLAHPGQADLTAHVDFAALARAATGLRVSAMTPQGVFLERLGITARAQALARGLTGAALESHIAAHRRLTHPQEMGTLFKTLALTPADAPAPPGLD
ncbi:class I SAM-dependent methyltransferase [Rhodovulum adriaticum]|uniref:SAM-dependent MidA family methyltransferase n=1 Tax=Rhodovulum adriaticum TaxID=35804 RepID=A0A4R2NW58_RHOAD|nr:SAM-dependent methyltransferase [Rhodovulum adriaticum]MBK1635254.1 methyltransferase [Rhodovulum adriaticum]TCP26389.1 SAM-dependent MidA family methyltransferase [Rhodovulum adriaticum]